ncbi:MAG: polar amino acid transport system substrate-binding protein [Candidatus Petromonas sp.]|jgi:predicted signal transduction protein with EAL and GGDEF domain|nr:polar amino acid transport system substrate-binding protein [Candidatus Petromonas sp.]
MLARFGGDKFTLLLTNVIEINDGRDEQTLLKNSDTAMYSAKEKGKNCFFFYMANMNEKILRYIDMENKLRNTIKNQEFVLFYQPKIDLKTGKIAV